jgi:hypothetical protein
MPAADNPDARARQRDSKEVRAACSDVCLPLVLPLIQPVGALPGTQLMRLAENTQRRKCLLRDFPGLEELPLLEVVKLLQYLIDSIDAADLPEDLNIEADRRLACCASPLHERQNLAGFGVPGIA